MERRDALKSLATLAGAAGMTVTPVTAKEANEIVLIVFRTKGLSTVEHAEWMRLNVEKMFHGTPLEGVRTLVVDDSVEVEFVRR